jgi:hypothetical protein
MNSDYLFLVRTPDQSPSDPEQTAVEAAKFKRTTVTGRKNGLPERNRQCPWATLEGFTYFAVLSIEQAQLKSVLIQFFKILIFLSSGIRLNSNHSVDRFNRVLTPWKPVRISRRSIEMTSGLTFHLPCSKRFTMRSSDWTCDAAGSTPCLLVVRNDAVRVVA